MKIFKVILVPILTCGLFSCQSALPKDTNVEKFPPVASCSSLPPAQAFSCIPKLLSRSEIILNSEGKILYIKKIESDTNCSRYEMKIVYGSELPEDQQMVRVIHYSSCSGSFWQNLKDNVVISSVSFGAGFITGLVLGILK